MSITTIVCLCILLFLIAPRNVPEHQLAARSKETIIRSIICIIIMIAIVFGMP